MHQYSDAELAAFLDEALPAGVSSQLEHDLRSSAELRNRLIEVRGRETAGLHSIGGIWRRGRLSCPTRSEMGDYLLGTLDPEPADYIRFHIETVGCRYCQANLADMQAAAKPDDQPTRRRTRYFETSAGYLKGKQS
ncbi:hypothetical protein K227x_06870 [Rubripirellula lacrimiformis]|uniref:Uncharacterized protein n=1 Tax=Rubripirellula lacrimiformis TaxID=1930273 RepID=A0A517N5B8_9BACT|nr:hypothetical protein [Rubripirellula lacrimiformis]QDT02311.1 hypothetical protein K227x_06870 [Rubripirellula lacrimiformis]